jgi:hypothetical protein
VLIKPDVDFWMAMMSNTPCNSRKRVRGHERWFIHLEGGPSDERQDVLMGFRQYRDETEYQ